MGVIIVVHRAVVRRIGARRISEPWLFCSTCCWSAEEWHSILFSGTRICGTGGIGVPFRQLRDHGTKAGLLEGNEVDQRHKDWAHHSGSQGDPKGSESLKSAINTRLPTDFRSNATPDEMEAAKTHASERHLWREGKTEGGPKSVSALAAFNQLCNAGQLEAAFEAVEQMAQLGMPVFTSFLSRLLEKCILQEDLDVGRRIHGLIIKDRFEVSDFLGSHLIRMYSACGSLVEAQAVFENLLARSVFVWAAIITAHCNHKQCDKALELYHELRKSGLEPDNYVFVAVLKACTSGKALAEGRLIHGHIVERGAELDCFVGNTLIEMYAKCGSMEDARQVFDRLPTRNNVAWIGMLKGYIQHGDGQSALKLFQKMQEEGKQPNQVTVVRVMKACASVGALDQGKLIHDHIRKCGFEANLFVGSALIDMYSKCGSLQDAQQVFDSLPTRDVVTWTTMIGAYADHGDGQEALRLLWQMQRGGLLPDKVALVSSLKACSTIAALEQGKLIHGLIMERGFDSNVFIGSILVDMYAKCGNLEDARGVFDGLPTRDLVTWNAMISGYSVHGGDKETIKLFQEMKQGGMEPNQVTLVKILKACSSYSALDQGRLIHLEIRERGLDSNVFLQSALIDLYCKCGSLEDAREVFDNFPTKDLVSWNAMIGGHVQQNDAQGALQLFRRMQQEGVQPDKVTFMSSLKACSSVVALDKGKVIDALVMGRESTFGDLVAELGGFENASNGCDKCQPREVSIWKAGLNKAALQQGKLLHDQIIESGFESDVFIRSTLIDMYAKCGSLEDARRVFERYPTRDLVAWNSMISGYVQQGAGHEALKLFGLMRKERMEPDQVTLLSSLKACASIAALDQGKQIHAHILETGLESDSVLANTLIDMYAKCGSLDDARRVFDRAVNKDQVTWNAMIGGYANHGVAKAAFQLFQRMQLEGMCPDHVTFVCLLSACSHVGLVDEGTRLFRSMCQDFCITPRMEHLVCMVDLLGRSGRLHEAESLVKEMPDQVGVDGLRSLLGACKTYGDVELGRRTFEAILEIDPSHAAPYVLMADIYAAAGRWEDEGDIRTGMLSAGIKKEPGRTWMETDTEMHSFTVEDKQHPERKHIYAKLQDTMVSISRLLG